MFLILMILIFMLIVVFLLLIMNYLLSNFYLMNKRMKLFSFECGFDLFSYMRLPFSIHFYLISILFLIFDIEIVLLFPLINSLFMLNYLMWFFVLFMLLMILYLGLEFELNNGILYWIF